MFTNLTFYFPFWVKKKRLKLVRIDQSIRFRSIVGVLNKNQGRIEIRKNKRKVDKNLGRIGMRKKEKS